MAREVVIPKMGMTMKEGTLVEWSVPDGTCVVRGQVLYHLVTDKLDTDVEAEDDGVLRHGAAAGQTLPAGAVVGWIEVPGEASSVMSNGAPTERTRVNATPVARKVAAALGVDLAGVSGSGPSGRITKEDVEAAAARGVGSSTAAPRPPEPIPAAEAAEAAEAAGVSRLPLVGMRGVIAQRMHASLQEMAQLTLGIDVELDAANDLRAQLVDEWAADGVRPTITDLVNRACVQSLASHPALNASVTADAVERYAGIHLGVAVALDEGLLVPVIRDAHTLSLKELAAASARLAALSRDSAIALDDLSGSTFTVTSLGASGVTFFTPIINAPNVAILGVGSMRDGVAWDGDVPRRRSILTLSLTVDHRAVDGAPAAAFLAAVKSRLEHPLRLLL